MNTKISVSKTINNNEHVVILADRNDLSQLSAFCSDSECFIIRRAAKKDVSYFVLPQAKRYLFVHFLDAEADETCALEKARTAGNDILSQLAHYKLDSICLINHRATNHTLQYLEGMVLGNYHFAKYFKKGNGKSNSLKRIKVAATSASRAHVADLIAVLEATCIARNLVNEPQSFLSAETLSREIKNLGKKFGFSVKVFNKKKIETLKMGGILAVNKGSVRPPTFNVLEWKPKKGKNKKPVVLVGKGVVYDTGGLSLKPTLNSMDMMKSDMAGAATVVGALVAAAKSKLPLHLVALIPATDNRPGNEAYVPGDVIRMYSGTTVEVLNTDAEGRLVLADALHYAKQYQPELVMDFATLTGSAMYACGQEAICYMGNAPQGVKNKIEKSGHKVYERLIEFPLWREYGDQLKSNIADLKNMGGNTAGMITAGKFLEHFTDYSWLHFDIAGPAYLKTQDSYRTKEGTGVGVRLLYEFLKHY